MIKKIVILIAALHLVNCSSNKSESDIKQNESSGRGDQQRRFAAISAKDSVFIYRSFVYFDSGYYNGLDERSIFEYWEDIPDSALYYFEQAAHLEELPVEYRMTFASYAYNKNGDDTLVRDVLESWEGRDGRSLFEIMESYGVPFSVFGITEEQVRKCCPQIQYN